MFYIKLHVTSAIQVQNYFHHTNETDLGSILRLYLTNAFRMTKIGVDLKIVYDNVSDDLPCTPQ